MPAFSVCGTVNPNRLAARCTAVVQWLASGSDCSRSSSSSARLSMLGSTGPPRKMKRRLVSAAKLKIIKFCNSRGRPIGLGKSIHLRNWPTVIAPPPSRAWLCAKRERQWSSTSKWVSPICPNWQGFTTERTRRRVAESCTRPRRSVASMARCTSGHILRMTAGLMSVSNSGWAGY